MPTKKKATTNAAKKASKKVTKTSPPVVPGADGRQCDLDDICAYLKELSDWLKGDFYDDYKKVRIAVCNLDHQVFGGNGTKNLRFCTGGGAVEPAQPPDTPIW